MAVYAFSSPLLLYVPPSTSRLEVMLAAFICLGGAILLMMSRWDETVFVFIIAVVGGLAGLAIAPVVPLMYEEANASHLQASTDHVSSTDTLTGGDISGENSISFWQIYSIFDAAYAVGISIGPFFAGFAASGHVGGKGGGLAKWSQQCLGVFLVVICYSLLLAYGRHRYPEPGEPQSGYNPVKTKEEGFVPGEIGEPPDAGYQSSIVDGSPL